MRERFFKICLEECMMTMVSVLAVPNREWEQNGKNELLFCRK